MGIFGFDGVFGGGGKRKPKRPAGQPPPGKPSKPAKPKGKRKGK